MLSFDEKSQKVLSGNTGPRALIHAKSYRWCFTVFDDTLNNDLACLEECGLPWNDQILDYLICQLERAPTTGKLHYQGFCRFQRRVGLNEIQTYFQDFKGHYEIARGSEKQNVTYCTKSKSRVGGPWERGTPTHQGRRTDLHDIMDDIQVLSDRDILCTYPSQWVMYGRRFKDARNALFEQKFEKRHVSILKSQIWSDLNDRAAAIVDTFGIDKVYFKTMEKWWDGYEDQTVVIWRMEDLKQLDPCIESGWPYRLETKGGWTWLKATHIYILLNTPITVNDIASGALQTVAAVEYNPGVKLHR